MARLAKQPIQVPFDSNNNMMEYANSSWAKPASVVDNFVFDDALEFDGFSYGHTGSKFRFKSQKDQTSYMMFPLEAEKVVPLMEKGILRGRFTFVKKNNYYGIKMIE